MFTERLESAILRGERNLERLVGSWVCLDESWIRGLPMDLFDRGRIVMNRVGLTRVVVSVVLMSFGRAGMLSAAGGDGDEVDRVVEGNARFAARIAGVLGAEAKGNLFFSPMSISTAMSMTAAGARGKTLDEMVAVMGWGGLDPDSIQGAFGGLSGRMREIRDRGDVEFLFANAVWPEKTHPFLAEYIDSVEHGYDAGTMPVDFIGASEGARREINGWVEGRTKARIKDLLPEGSINELTRMVLTNAVYFRGDWAVKFPEASTRPGLFHVSRDTAVEVPMMHGKVRAGLREEDGVTFLELPYRGDELSMVVILPSGTMSLDGLNDLIERHLPTLVRMEFRRRELDVVMPRFKVASGFSLGGTLAGMGMKEAFSMSADLSGMDGSRWLYISDVFHKAFLEVTEAGTEAAAATGVVISLKSAARPTPPVVVDRPFWMAIRDNVSGSILFLGRIVNP